MAIFWYNNNVSGIAERYMDNTLSNGRIDQKNIKFPKYIQNRSFDPSTYNRWLIQLSAQKGLNIRNNPAVADKSFRQERFANITTGSILVLCTKITLAKV
jgi:hypothetical protein